MPPQQPQQQPQGDQPAARAQSLWQQWSGTIFRFALIWFAMRMFQTPRQPTVAIPPDPSATGTSRPDNTAQPPQYFPVLPSGVYYSPFNWIPPKAEGMPANVMPFWQDGVQMDLLLYVSENEYFTDYSAVPAVNSKKIKWGDWKDERTVSFEIPATPTIQNNGTVYAHIFLRQHNAPLDPEDPKYFSDRVVYVRHLLNKYYPKKRVIKQKKLLDSSNKAEEDHAEDVDQAENEEQPLSGGSILQMGNWTRKAPLASYWHRNLTLNIISDTKAAIPIYSVPPIMQKYVRLEKSGAVDRSGKFGYYLPILYPNDFWNLKDHAFAINETINTLPLTITISPLSFFRFQLYSGFTQSLEQQQSSPMGGATMGEVDELKRMFIETNPILLGTTIVVSLLHSLFEFLAFKNDIAFWNKKQDTTGVSIRTLFVNIFFQIVIFLYLLDNNQETSWMILIGQGFGLVIEMWKVWKALKFEVVRVTESAFPYRVRFSDAANNLSETESKTAEYDQQAYRYLSWVTYPLLIGYSIYSLVYESHKSWYSYVLGTLVGFVYLFGFITMTPQLFINYKLKSIAHMPWKTLMYKSLNTFIDDLFAFCIKMPMLHRLACLRDDVVFFVYLYQRWAYRVDPTRVNEYGQVGTVNEETKDVKVAESKKDQ